MCLFSIAISLVRWLFKYLVHFLSWVVFYYIFFKEFFMYSGYECTCFVTHTYFSDVFSLSLPYALISLAVSSEKQMFLILMNSVYQHALLLTNLLLSYQENLCLTQDHKYILLCCLEDLWFDFIFRSFWINFCILCKVRFEISFLAESHSVDSNTIC